jgi:hypothetical protein
MKHKNAPVGDAYWRKRLALAKAEISRLRATLDKIADPLTLKVGGIGMERALRTIAKMQSIARGNES